MLQQIFQAANNHFNLPPNEINCGDCTAWANLVYFNWPGVQVWASYSTYEYHCFVKIGDLFYDAECHQGVSDYNLLPFFQRKPTIKQLVRQDTERQ